MKTAHRIYLSIGAMFFLAHPCSIAEPAAGSTTPPDQGKVRPFIWTRLSERDRILTRIRTLDWAAAQFHLLQTRADTAAAAHQMDRDAYLRQLPLDTRQGAPTFVPVTTVKGGDGALLRKFGEGIDCAAMYYLTGAEKYARCAADILHNSVLGYVNLAPTFGTTTGGWIYSNGLLGEASQSGMYLPIIYDYLYHYLKTGPRVFQLNDARGTEVTYGTGDFANAQTLFRTYYRLTRDRGLANNNWSPNMAKSLVPCVLALDDPAEREEALKDYLTRDNERQTSLRTDAARYPRPGDIWPESLDYSEAVNTIHPYLMQMVDRYDPSLNLFTHYPNVAQSMARPFQLVFPNGRQIHFGDFHHDDSRQPYFQYELVYGYAQARNLPHLRELYGPLINAGIAAGLYDRSAQTVKSPLPIFWFADAVTESPTALQIPRTDTLSHAGIALQRNLSPTHNPADGLMCFVGGGAHVHSHATGMNIELYGQGFVLGAEGGKGDYRSELHENYYRLFAAHNSVIVNGASGSTGGWVNLGINTVQVAAMEPLAFQAAVSPDFSFTCTTFVDDQAKGTEASQQRTLGIVRTSATTGYYVDVFRSQSKLPNQFHDYLYHNIGESMDLATTRGPLALTPSKNRFVPVPGTAWKRNESYQHPGWQYFRETQTSAPLAADVTVTFTADKLSASPVRMRLFIPGSPGRSYTRAFAPETKAAPETYRKLPTPVLVIRQQGEAWHRPFAVIYESFTGGERSSAIRAVTALNADGKFAGFKVVSQVAGHRVTQYVLTPAPATNSFEDATVGISFRGRYAVISVDESGKCTALYLGEGSKLSFQSTTLSSVSGENTAAAAEIDGETATLTANAPAELVLPGGKRVTSVTPNPL